KLLIEYHHPKRALIFCNTKRMVDDLAATLSQGGFKAVAIHGDMRQTQRTSVMNEFKSGRTNILIATDVAARGIDVEDVEAVFNFDIPQEYEYYIHRIGRTGRAGKEGASYTLAANRNQLARIREIERYVGAPIEEKPVPSLENIAEQKMEFFAKEIKSRIDEGIDDGWKTFIENLVEDGYSLEDIAASLCTKIQNKNKRLVAVRNVSSFGGRKQTGNGQGRCWVRVNIGSSAKIGPNFIVGAIVDATGINPSKIGKINIFPEHTDVDMFEADAQTVISGTKNLKIKGKPVNFVLANNNTGDKKFGGGNRGKNYSKPYNSTRRNDKSGSSYRGDRDSRPSYKRNKPQ
ncbi:MAG: C-terminal helicase domain-containing protein, partial [Clostridiales bacterium]